MGASRKHTLSKAEKLKSRKQIDALFMKRRFFTSHPLRVFYLIETVPDSVNGTSKDIIAVREDAIQTDSTGIQAGFSSSKRFFKHATKRNRVKRLMREVYRKHKQPLADLVLKRHCHLSIFFLYGHSELPEYAAVEEKMLQLLSKIEVEVAKG